MSAPQLSPRDQPRLHAQVLRIQRLYLSHPGSWFSLGEIVRAIGGASEAGVSARLRDLRKAGWSVEKRKRGRALWEYVAKAPGQPQQLELIP